MDAVFPGPTVAALNGAELIAAERERQINEEGFRTERDVNLYTEHELTRAAFAYLMVPLARAEGEEVTQDNLPEELWPWDMSWWKPGTDLQSLVKAGALIAAEIDRRIAVDAITTTAQSQAV